VGWSPASFPRRNRGAGRDREQDIASVAGQLADLTRTVEEMGEPDQGGSRTG